MSPFSSDSRTQLDDRGLHVRLLERDPTASSDLAEAYVGRLAAWLGDIAPTVHEDVRQEAAEDALLALIRNPASYHPEAQSLEVYLRMSARGDLLNLLAKERRRRRHETPCGNVELLPGARKYLARDDDPSLPLRLVEEPWEATSTVPDAVRRTLSETDRLALELILQKERRYDEFAKIYGLSHLPGDERKRVVKRHKDRLKKLLKRAEGKA